MTMGIAYSSDFEDGFENKMLEAYHERARLTRLLTLQQDLLALVMHEEDQGVSSLGDLAERVQMAFAADGGIIAFDNHVAALQDDMHLQVVRGPGVPQYVAEQFANSTEIAGSDGPVPPDQLTMERTFAWYWAEAICDTQGQSACGRIILLFKDERIPVEEERLAMRAVGPYIHLLLRSMVQSRELKSAHERFANLASTIPGVVYQRRVRPDGDIRYTYISETAQELFGVSAHEILTNPHALFDCYAPEYADTFRTRLLEASRTLSMWDVEASIVTPSGEQKYTHAIARPEREPDGSVLWTGVILDASRIKKAELEAAATEARTRAAIVDSLPQGFLLFDAEDKLALRNGHFDNNDEHFSVVAREGAHYNDVIRAELEIGLDRPRTDEELEAQLAGRLGKHNIRRYFAVERQVREDFWVLIGEKRTPEGGTVVLYTDITDIKRQDEKLQRHADRLERVNAELQQFAYVASHDLQEPLRKIEAFGDRLVSRCGDQLGDNGKLYADRMMNAAGRMRQLINDLLSYSRVGTQTPITDFVDLSQTATEVTGDLEQAILEKHGRIEIGGLPTIQADPTQMRQLFQNLISNSIKYSDENRAPIVRIEADEAESGSVEIRIIDNGIGFEPKYAERIFEVFQRLHGRSEYAGTGIGLATCRRIVERHKGSISATSEPGVGTTFTLVLPCTQEIDASGIEEIK